MSPLVIAHRGASYRAPENTLIAFQMAMEIGSDGVEMDVQQTADKGLVIHHDYLVDFHTDITGKIYDLTEGELRALDFGSWKSAIYEDVRIATLSEALATCKDLNCRLVMLEMKSTMDNDSDFVPRIIDEIRKSEFAENLLLISFNHKLLRQAKQLMPELKVGLLLFGEIESILFPAEFWNSEGEIAGNWKEENGLPDETDEENLEEENASPVSIMTRLLSDRVSMLRASFPGESMREILNHLKQQRDPAAYVKSLDFQVEWVSCEYHTAYSNPRFVGQLRELGVKTALWTVDTEQELKWLMQVEPDAFVTNRPDHLKKWLETGEKTEN